MGDVGSVETSLDDDVEWGEWWRGVWPPKARDPWAAGVDGWGPPVVGRRVLLGVRRTRFT